MNSVLQGADWLARSVLGKQLCLQLVDGKFQSSERGGSGGGKLRIGVPLLHSLQVASYATPEVAKRLQEKVEAAWVV